MTTKAIVLRLDGHPQDQIKIDALKAIDPKPFATFTGGGLASCAADFGSIDYLLITGGHGDFLAGKPALFNGASIDETNAFLSKCHGTIKAIVLDTCYTSALVPSFLPLVPAGGCIICAHGVSEGWAAAFTSSNGKATVGSVLADIVGQAGALGTTSSLALVVKKPTNLLLRTQVAGANRRAVLDARKTIFDPTEVDTEVELKQLDRYLQDRQIATVEIKEADLQALLKQSLPMTVM